MNYPSWKNISGLLTLVAILTLVGCAGPKTVVGTPVAERDNYDMSTSKTITSRFCGYHLGNFIPINSNQRFAISYRRLVRQSDGGFITDVKMSEKWTYTFAGQLLCTSLKAKVYPAKTLSSVNQPFSSDQ